MARHGRRGQVGSDADAAEDLARVLASQARSLERVRARRRDPVAEQTGSPAGRVHVDRPLAAFAAADHAPPVAQGGREILVRDDREPTEYTSVGATCRGRPRSLAGKQAAPTSAAGAAMTSPVRLRSSTAGGHCKARSGRLSGPSKDGTAGEARGEQLTGWAQRVVGHAYSPRSRRRNDRSCARSSRMAARDTILTSRPTPDLSGGPKRGFQEHVFRSLRSSTSTFLAGIAREERTEGAGYGGVVRVSGEPGARRLARGGSAIIRAKSNVGQ